MERCAEMKKYIEDYCCVRKNEKREYLNRHYNDVLTPLLMVVETLIQDMENKQAAKAQGKIKNLKSIIK